MVSERFSLSGKIALLAGNSRFWSKYVAAALAGAGADVAVAGKSQQKLEEAIGEVQRLGRRALAVPTDTAQSSQVERMVERVVGQFGKIDILVNANDLQFAKPLLETTEHEWHRVIEANLTSVFLCCQAAGRRILKQKRGRIVNITSCLAERGIANGVTYCAAMGGVLQLSRALSLEWAPKGTTVNAIGVGWFSETDETIAEKDRPLLEYLPSGRFGHPSEIGSLVVYLASDATDFINGQFMYVDGAVMQRR